MEQAAVGVIALELDLERGGEVEGLGGGGKPRLDIVCLLSHSQGVDLLKLLHAILILDLLLVIGDQSFLLHIAVIESARRGAAVLIGSHLAVAVGFVGERCRWRFVWRVDVVEISFWARKIGA